MKGNEARVVFFLHPVDKVRDGEVAKVEPLKNSLGVASLLLVALLLGLGVLGYLFFPMVSTTTQTLTTTASPSATITTSTETPSTAPAKSVIGTSARTTTEKETSKNAEVVSMARPTSWHFYPLVVSGSILLAYFTVVVVRFSYSRSKLVQGMTRWLIGKPPKEEKMLLHTLPYYLAITRSSCEVVCLFCFASVKEIKRLN